MANFSYMATPSCKGVWEKNYQSCFGGVCLFVFVSIKRRISGRRELGKVFGSVNPCFNTLCPAAITPA